MFERFADYMYYLLTAPFKRVRKEINQWYLLFKVLGKRLDEAKEALQRARDETMVATCSPLMLQEHGRDRGLSRYEGEELESYRKRIAIHSQVCSLGGTNEGIILAVKSLGYDNVAVIPAREYYGDSSRWAEFVLIIPMEADSGLPIKFAILREIVRQWKEAGAKDNYCMQYFIRIREPHQCGVAMAYKKYSTYFLYLMLDGMWELDGELAISSNRKQYVSSMGCSFTAQNAHGCSVAWYRKHSPYLLDGVWKVDGSRILDAFGNREVL